MTNFRNTYLAASLFVLGCFLLIGGRLSAGEKKETPKAALLLSKAEELTDDDEKDTHPALEDSCRGDPARSKLAAGKTYQIDLKSKAFDAVLRLEDSAGKEVAFNDDFNPGASLDSRIVYAATKAGEYTIIATCLDGKTGKFNLTVAAGPVLCRPSRQHVQGQSSQARVQGRQGDLCRRTLGPRRRGEKSLLQDFHYRIGRWQKPAASSTLMPATIPSSIPFCFSKAPDGGRRRARRRFRRRPECPHHLQSRKDRRLPHRHHHAARRIKPANSSPEITPGTADDIKDSSTWPRALAKYALSTPAEQKKTRGAVLNHFRDRGANLTIRDVQHAFQLTMATDNMDV